jgi:uncharacterized repeat protein (TIGR04002 family)
MNKTRLIVTTAVFAALTCVLTFTVKIPTALGYIHPGDGVIYLAACILPFPYAFISGAIGGALSDFLGGYPQWIIPTLIIKALISLPFYRKSVNIMTKRNAFMIIPAGLISVVGYFIASYIIYDWAGAVAGITGNLLQAGMSASVFIVLAPAFDRMKFKQWCMK